MFRSTTQGKPLIQPALKLSVNYEAKGEIYKEYFFLDLHFFGDVFNKQITLSAEKNYAYCE
jgi:hypothetical protein